MMHGKLLDELRAQAATTGLSIESRFRKETQPRVADLLVDVAATEIRRAMGEDVTTAELALDASFANVALHERQALVVAGRDLAFRVLATIVRVGIAAI